MTQTPSLPLFERLTTDPASKVDSTKTYGSRLRRQLRFGLILIGMGLFGLFPLKGVLDWLTGAPVPNSKTFFALFILLVLPVCAFAILIVNAVRGLPRLTIAPQGITLKSSFGTKWAAWDSIEPFTMRTMNPGRLSKPIQMAAARVVGPNTTKSLRRAKAFIVPDHFRVPIDTILQNLNAARPQTIDAHGTLPFIELAESAVGLVNFKLPWLTFALLAVLVFFYALENQLTITPSVGSTPSLVTLFALGALSSKAIMSDGQWYRLFTAPLLHANAAHLIGNCVALLMGGWLLERLVGRLWFFALFVIGALGGSLMSLAMGSPHLISVGASGAIMGLFAALCASSFRLAPGTPARARLQVHSARILIPSLLPLFSTSGVHIDYGAHFGGALSGAIAGAALLKFWPETERIPQLRKLAAAIAGVGAILFVTSANIAISNYHTYRVAAVRPFPAIVPGLNLFPSTPPRPVPQPGSSPLETPSNITLDHGPGRVACDLQWSRSPEKSADSYPDFLRTCMKNNQQ